MILLDTHAVIWVTLNPDKLSSRASAVILNARSSKEVLALSAVSIFEIASEIREGRIATGGPARNFFAQLRRWTTILPVTDSIAQFAGQLPRQFPGDPIDRLIAATAVVEGATLVTADSAIRESGVCPTIW